MSTRRDFLKTTSAAAAVALLGTAAAAAGETEKKQPVVPMKKAVKYGMFQSKLPMAERFKKLKEIGFDGVELNSPNDNKVDEVLDAIQQSGLPVHGLVDSVHWNQTLSHPDPNVREQGTTALKTALKDAKAYGATSVLLVPAVVNKEVSYGDAYTRSQAEIRKALPLAEELGIDILLENVWNNFLLSPVETARYIDELESQRVGSYFDVGNVVRYGWPEHWILALNKRIRKLDIKEYSQKLHFEQGPYKGFNVELTEGDCDWPTVMQTLKQIGFSGWGTAEVAGGDEARMQDIATRMDKCFAG